MKVEFLDIHIQVEVSADCREMLAQLAELFTRFEFLANGFRLDCIEVFINLLKRGMRREQFLGGLLADTPDEQESIERGIQAALRKSSPLGNVAEDDLGEFFKSMTSDQQQEAISLQLQWNANVSETESKAIAKWQEWRRK